MNDTDDIGKWLEEMRLKILNESYTLEDVTNIVQTYRTRRLETKQKPAPKLPTNINIEDL